MHVYKLKNVLFHFPSEHVLHIDTTEIPPVFFFIHNTCKRPLFRRWQLMQVKYLQGQVSAAPGKVKRLQIVVAWPTMAGRSPDYSSPCHCFCLTTILIFGAVYLPLFFVGLPCKVATMEQRGRGSWGEGGLPQGFQAKRAVLTFISASLGNTLKKLCRAESERRQINILDRACKLVLCTFITRQ